MSPSAEQKPRATVFYSWQSDLPNATNRGLIFDALERAAKNIKNNESVAVEPVLDRDTQGVPGAPDIAHTIFDKIEKATAFVADVSIINPGLGRPTPNPNVLIELGYALKTLRNSRTILVANTATGPVESLPFDLRSKRILTYHLPTDAQDKPEQRKKLTDGLENALRAILSDARPPQLSSQPTAAEKAIQSIEAGSSSQRSLCLRVVPAIAKQIEALTPKLDPKKADLWDDQLLEALQQSLPSVTEFAKVADLAAISNSGEAASGLFLGFGPLFTQYNLAPDFSGSFYDVQFDLPKFIGHELMTILFAALIREHRWSTVAALVRDTVLVPNATRRFDETQTPVTYVYASEYIKLLDHRNNRLKLNRVSLHADLLKQRHETGELGDLSSWRDFHEADVFLYLRSGQSANQFDLWDVWRPWSAAFLRGAPGFLIEAIRREKAAQLLEPFGVRSLDDLRTLLKERIDGLAKLFSHRNPFYHPFEGFNPDSIGTK